MRYLVRVDLNLDTMPDVYPTQVSFNGPFRARSAEITGNGIVSIWFEVEHLSVAEMADLEGGRKSTADTRLIGSVRFLMRGSDGMPPGYYHVATLTNGLTGEDEAVIHVLVNDHGSPEPNLNV